MNNHPSFGQLVKAHRRELGLTQEELARRVGCTPTTVNKSRQIVNKRPFPHKTC